MVRSLPSCHLKPFLRVSVTFEPSWLFAKSHATGTNLPSIFAIGVTWDTAAEIMLKL